MSKYKCKSPSQTGGEGCGQGLFWCRFLFAGVCLSSLATRERAGFHMWPQSDQNTDTYCQLRVPRAFIFIVYSWQNIQHQTGGRVGTFMYFAWHTLSTVCMGAPGVWVRSEQEAVMSVQQQLYHSQLFIILTSSQLLEKSFTFKHVRIFFKLFLSFKFWSCPLRSLGVKTPASSFLLLYLQVSGAIHHSRSH